MNKKLTIVINGKGGAGKDTLCRFAEKWYKIWNISSIDPIKEIAKQNGWKGEKTPAARKFLSDLKKAFTDYNDLPTRYITEKHEQFMESDAQILFVHIREPQQISRFLSRIQGACFTLLVKRGESQILGNDSDDLVEQYPYDGIFDNSVTLEEAEIQFKSVLDEIFQIHAK
jgi:dephospho-CoA kinase